MSPFFRATIEVQPKVGISNPTAATVNHNLPKAFPEYFTEDVLYEPPEITAFGKIIRLTIDAASEEDASRQLEQMKTEPVISNPVIEDANVIEVTEQADK